MQLKDYIAIVALLVSLASLAIAHKKDVSSKRATAIDKKILVLAKLSETSMVNERVFRLHQKLLVISESSGDSSLLDGYEAQDFDDIAFDLSSIYKTLSNGDVNLAVVVYEHAFHRVVSIYNKLTDCEKKFTDRLSEAHRVGI